MTAEDEEAEATGAVSHTVCMQPNPVYNLISPHALQASNSQYEDIVI